jgi:UDP-2,4-diacetamido-2,4,6-trideoxy-beta-L-altropyranose hydrolase
MRCIALGQAWQNGGRQVQFITYCENSHLLQRLRDECFTVIELMDPEDFDPRHYPAYWFVLDGYHFSVKLQRAIRYAGSKLIVLDDCNHLPEYSCDLLVNQNFGAEELAYRCSDHCRKLLGSRYALLRREFRDAEPMTGQYAQDDGMNLLVTLGGADPGNMTLQVIEALGRLDVPGLRVKVVIGPANPHMQTLRDAVQNVQGRIELVSSTNNMAALMRWAVLALSAGSSTCWELCRLGVPFCTIVLADNQERLAGALDRRGIAPCLGRNPSAEEISCLLASMLADSELREKAAAAGQMLIDGFGVERVLAQPAKDLEIDLFKGRLSMRKAAEADRARYWLWANDATVRSNSYNPDFIPYPAHCEWFDNRVHSPNTLMLVMELDGVPVGQVRYEAKGESALLAFSIAAEFRGLGFGQRIVKQSLNRAFSELKLKAIRAEVFADNKASAVVFVKNGFSLIETCRIKNIPSLVYVRNKDEFRI